MHVQGSLQIKVLCKNRSPLQQSCSESIRILQKIVQESNSHDFACCREYLARCVHQWSYIIYACKVASFCKINNFLHAHAKTICKITTHSFNTATQFSVYSGTHGGSIHSLWQTAPASRNVGQRAGLSIPSEAQSHKDPSVPLHCTLDNRINSGR